METFIKQPIITRQPLAFEPTEMYIRKNHDVPETDQVNLTIRLVETFADGHTIREFNRNYPSTFKAIVTGYDINNDQFVVNQTAMAAALDQFGFDIPPVN